MKFSVSIMAAPPRRHLLPALKAALNDPPVSMDDGKGLILNSQRAWAMHDPAADWHIVVQDDAVLTSNFLGKVPAVLEDAAARGCECVNFHYGGHRAPEAGNAFIIRRSLHWGIAVCLPVRLIKPMITFVRGQGWNPHDDGRISQFIMSRGGNVYYPIPSLAEHGQVPSLIGGADGRKAFKFEP